jgi:UDP-N-acetylmuramoyl-tripeptide--D-alanyl-D-alanine ligase
MEVLPAQQPPYFRFALGGRTITTKLVGAYNQANVCAAIAVGRYFNVPDSDIVDAIQEYQPVNSRSQWINTEHNCLIVDAYNANPSSMAAAIDNLEHSVCGNKCLILGEMLELGDDSRREHLAILQQVEAAGFAEAFFVGKNFTTLPKPKRYLDFETAAELSIYLARNPLQGRTILIKGSNGVHLERIPELL